MKRFIKIMMVAAAALLAVSCYEDFLKDYEFSAVYFASQKPMRTIIAGGDPTIEVGVAISGKREVDPNDWATFEISLIDMVGSGLVLLPENYYTLSDPTTMKVKKSNLPLAVVKLTLTDDFFADPLSTTKYYGLPFHITGASTDSVLTDKSTTVVAIKYASSWSGTYCVKGSISELDGTGAPVSTVEYGDTELSSTFTRATATLSKDIVVVGGVGNTFPAAAGDMIVLTFGADGALTVDSAPGGIVLSEASGSYAMNGDRLQVNLSYKFTKGTKDYAVTETLLRRQDPAKDLYFEEW